MAESMPKDSAGVLLFRGDAPDGLEVLLAHPGGPVWAKKDDQGWTIPKGEPSPGEDLLAAAKREFEEEMGSAPSGEFLRARIDIAAEREEDRARLGGALASSTSRRSRATCSRWSGRRSPAASRQFVEVDRAQWFPLAVARRKIWPGQVPFLDRLIEALAN